MALMIVTESCAACDACSPECPNEAIAHKKGLYVIDWERCTECVGFYDEPQCAAVCPIGATCIADPHHPEGREELMAKKQRLHAAEGMR